MRKKNYKLLLVVFILSLVVNSQVVKGQNSGLVLKGKVLTPTAQNNKTPANNKPAATAASAQVKPTSANAAAHAQVKLAAPKPYTPPVVVKVAPAMQHNLQLVDYTKRVLFIHNLVCKRVPERLIDSIEHINHFMLDSIRMEITRHRDKDSVSFLQTALSNGLNDSATLVNVNILVNSANGDGTIQNSGSINAYCIDLTTQAPMDSIKVSVYIHDSLIAIAYSANDGFCKIAGLKPGEYSLGFFKNSYTPFSDRWVKVTADNITYLEMPLTETPRFYLPKFSVQIWAIILVGVVSVFILIYSIIRRLGRVA